MIFYDADTIFTAESKVNIDNTPTTIRPSSSASVRAKEVYCWEDDYFELTWNKYGFLYSAEYIEMTTGGKFFIKKMIAWRIRRLIKL